MEEAVRVDAAGAGLRLDKFITLRFPSLSRTFAQELIEQGRILVAGRSRKPNFRVGEGQLVTMEVPPRQPTTARGEDISLNIVYEDSALLVVDKPAGMVVHPSAGHAGGTLVNAVLWRSPETDVGNRERPGIVHRLDRDTSGLILIAKNSRALEKLQRQFAAREVHKTYLALVHGRVSTPRGLIDAPVGRDPRDRKRMSVQDSPSARAAQTAFAVEQLLENHSLLRVEPATGRTHQIRVHLAYIHHPVVGDAVYGRRRADELGLKRQFLHASRISFLHPETGEREEFHSPLPKELETALRIAGGDPARLAH